MAPSVQARWRMLIRADGAWESLAVRHVEAVADANGDAEPDVRRGDASPRRPAGSRRFASPIPTRAWRPVAGIAVSGRAASNTIGSTAATAGARRAITARRRPGTASRAHPARPAEHAHPDIPHPHCDQPQAARSGNRLTAATMPAGGSKLAGCRCRETVIRAGRTRHRPRLTGRFSDRIVAFFNRP